MITALWRKNLIHLIWWSETPFDFTSPDCYGAFHAFWLPWNAPCIWVGPKTFFGDWCASISPVTNDRETFYVRRPTCHILDVITYPFCFPIHFICDVLLAELVRTYFTSVSSLAFSLIARSTVVEVLSSKRLRASLLVTYRRTCVCIMFTVFLQHITVYNFYCVGHTHVYCMYGGVN